MITVLGASGFIGSNLCRRLRESGIAHYAPERAQLLAGRQLGDVIYCIGLTADFRSRVFDTVEAHVCHLATMLHDCEFDSVLYLSTTRLYRRAAGPAQEDDVLSVAPQEADDLYNISKAMGESLVLSRGRCGRVARISNVYGGDFESENFLSAVIREAVATGAVTVRTSPESEKDYVAIDDVVTGLIQIATQGQHPVYNLASGINVTNAALLDRLRELTGCSVEFLAGAPEVKFPPISVRRMREEFGFAPAQLPERLGDLVNLYRSTSTKG